MYSFKNRPVVSALVITERLVVFDAARALFEWIYANMSDSGYQNALHRLDPATLRWTDLSPMASGDVPAARQSSSMDVLDGILYLFGGRSAKGEAP